VRSKARYDQEADAAYLQLSAGTIHESEEIAPDIIVDFDADGKIVGLEFLRASEQFSAEALTSFGQAD